MKIKRRLLRNSGRIAGSGTSYDRYDEESTPEVKSFPKWIARMIESKRGVRFPNDPLVEGEERNE